MFDKCCCDVFIYKLVMPSKSQMQIMGDSVDPMGQNLLILIRLLMFNKSSKSERYIG